MTRRNGKPRASRNNSTRTLAGYFVTLCHGVPCITTSFNGAAEVIEDGVEGFVIERPDDIGLWARRIEELASPELRRKMSEKAVLLRDRLGMARHVEELDGVFAEVAKGKSGCV